MAKKETKKGASLESTAKTKPSKKEVKKLPNYDKKLAETMECMDAVHSRINELELILDEHKAIILQMRGRMGV